MEEKINNIKIPFTLHNKYEIKIINKIGEVKEQFIAYNQANSSGYISCGYIDTIKILGRQSYTRLIEPYPEEEGNPSDYWEREGLPNLQKNKIISCYKAKIQFRDVSAGYIDEIQLLSRNSVVSSVKLKDIEGHPIKIIIEDGDWTLINVFIYFSADMSGKDKNEKFYPIKWYGPSGSVLGGCCGIQIDLLEQQKIRLSHNKVNELPVFINDGYMPRAVNKYLALSRAPMPKTDEDGYLTGVINNYSILKPNIIEFNKGIFKNSNLYETNLSPGTPIFGLIRTLVLPGIGVIDMKEICGKKGPGGQGVFEGITYYNKNKPCYLPEEYVREKDNTLISIKKNAFYNANVIVRRFKSNIENSNEEVPLNTIFFSDIITDARKRRCMGFSQHVPLTENYCGAETVIPCIPGGFINSDIHYYGYYIVYTGKDIENSFLKANYAVSGQVLEIPYTGQRNLITFPYKLEYSYNGVDFETAVEFTRNSAPYQANYFNPIAAPIWRITGGINGACLNEGNNTTHSDKYVAQAAGLNKIGYDPLFLFVGFDSDHGEPVIPEGVEIVDTPNFKYGDNMGALDKYKVLVPYLGHSTDNIYFSSNFAGELTSNKENE